MGEKITLGVQSVETRQVNPEEAQPLRFKASCERY